MLFASARPPLTRVLVGAQSRGSGPYQKKSPMPRKSNHVKVTHTMMNIVLCPTFAWEIEYYVNVWTSPRIPLSLFATQAAMRFSPHI